MPAFRHQHDVLAMSEAKGEAQTGHTLRLSPSEGDAVNDTSQLFRVFFDVQQIGGASSPTTDVSLETSHDGSSWFKLVGATQVTSETTMHEWKEVTAVGPYVRATTTLGGGTKPTHKVQVVLSSTAPFKLRSV